MFIRVFEVYKGFKVFLLGFYSIIIIIRVLRFSRIFKGFQEYTWRQLL
jgi:hypothetical protein